MNIYEMFKNCVYDTGDNISSLVIHTTLPESRIFEKLSRDYNSIIAGYDNTDGLLTDIFAETDKHIYFFSCHEDGGNNVYSVYYFKKRNGDKQYTYKFCESQNLYNIF